MIYCRKYSPTPSSAASAQVLILMCSQEKKPHAIMVDLLSAQGSHGLLLCGHEVMGPDAIVPSKQVA